MVWTLIIHIHRIEHKTGLLQSTIQQHYSWTLMKDVLSNDFRRKRSAKRGRPLTQSCNEFGAFVVVCSSAWWRGRGGGLLRISSDWDDQMGAKLKTPKNP